MITYPIFINLCKKKFCNVIGFTIFHLSEAATGGVLVLRNFTKFTAKYLWQSLFFNKLTG